VVGDDSSKLASDISFKYRLDPLEDWSDYSPTTKATYYFLTRGNYTFKVKARYKVKGEEKETSEATYPIRVTEVIPRPPPLDLLPIPPAQLEHFRQQHHYVNSRALLIGVSEYQDYQALPWVKNDVNLLDSVLQKHSFLTQKLDSVTNRTNVRAAVKEFIDASHEGERTILYFSGHGGARGLINFLAPSDCNPQTGENCIDYEELQGWINRLTEERRVKHLLVILDACQAGLGLYSKSSTTRSLEELARYRGAHLMTAGLLGQNAQIDIGEKTSVFTKMLVKGLEGQADLIKDKVLTLSELLAFVQGGVS
jgi:glycosylphosphatidylinositol transamidase (GPIT) subunit GPI8